MKTRLKLMILIRIVAFGIIFLSWGLIPAIVVTAIFLLSGLYVWGIIELPSDWVKTFALFAAEVFYAVVILMAMARFMFGIQGILLATGFFLIVFVTFNFAHTRSD